MARFNNSKSPFSKENNGFKCKETEYYDKDEYFGNIPKIKNKILNTSKDRYKFIMFINANLGVVIAL